MPGPIPDTTATLPSNSTLFPLVVASSLVIGQASRPGPTSSPNRSICSSSSATDRDRSRTCTCPTPSAEYFLNTWANFSGGPLRHGPVSHPGSPT